ncbi:MAG: AbrB/MazE/SpoVT family DNA-binding domain-containing protein [Chloroflexota bacterium]
MLVKVSAKGQITLPQNLRQLLGIKPGDSIVITQNDDGLMLRPVTETLFDLRGIVPVSGPQDFEAVIEEAKRLVATDIVGGLNNG